MHTSKYQTTVRPIFKKYFKPSSRRSRSGQSCDPQPDCCGRLPKKPKRNPEEPFIERDCFPDIYSAWKPKIPKLIPTQCEVKTQAPCYIRKKCYASMKAPPSLAETKPKAEECLKANDPKAINSKLAKPEVIILSTCPQMSQNKYVFVTDFAYNVLCSKRPRSRRKTCHCSQFYNNRHHLKNK